ncbi:hypothetical protein ACK8HH_18345 [Gordonia sp. LUNF6]|uniref:hypothetical protein n=1 Tax=Gordonia sp. LUNF6 TaxID=3388658 RepID=UPI00399960DE
MTDTAWDRYLGAVNDLAAIDGELIDERRRSDHLFQERERNVAVEAADREQCLAGLDGRRDALSEQLDAAARTIGLDRVPAAAVPQQARHAHVVLADLELVVGRLQKHASVVEGYERAKKRIARDEADRAVRREELTAKQAERERKLAEARERAVDERRRHEPTRVAKPVATDPLPAPPAPSRTGAIVAGAVGTLIVLIIVLVLIL